MALEKIEREKMEQQMALDRMEREKEEIEKELGTLQNLFIRRDNEMKKAILDKLGIMKKMAAVFQTIEQRNTISHEKMKELVNDVVSIFSMDKIIAIANELYPDIFGKLKKYFTDINLTERDKCICYMIICDFTNEQIAIFLDRKKSNKTVENWKTELKKKFGMKSSVNLKKQLMEIITENPK